MELGFFERAIFGATWVGFLCGILGFFVVLRRLAFLGVGISHSAVGGVAIGWLIGWPPLLTAAIFSIAVALGIGAVAERKSLNEDTVIGVFFSGSMALALVLFSMTRGSQQDLFGYLFGNVLALRTTDLAILVVVGVAVLAVLAVSLRTLLFVAFDSEVAEAYGVRVGRWNTLLLVLLAVTILLGARLVGVLLVEALLVIPAATAALWAGHYRSRILVAGTIGALSGVVGFGVAYWANVATGGTIVLVALVPFLLSLPFRRTQSA